MRSREMRSKEVMLKVAENMHTLNAQYAEEADILDDTLCLLEVAGAYIVRPEVGLRRGLPDIMVCFAGDFIGIELKDDEGAPSKQQLCHINKIRKAGGRAGICSTLGEVLDLLYGEN